MQKKTKCIIVEDEKIARDILESHLSKIDRIDVVASCKNVAEAYNVLKSEHVDLVFLDINLPETSGLSFAKSIHQNIKIIFTTAYREYAVDGFDLQAVDYLLKPISFERLLRALDKFLRVEEEPVKYATGHFSKSNSDFVFVRSDRKMIKVDFSDILYVESLGDYVRIHVEGRIITTRETISNFEDRLPRDVFIRVHRSYLVSINHIDAFTNEDLMIGKYEIPISRTFKKEVLQRLGQEGL